MLIDYSYKPVSLLGMVSGGLLTKLTRDFPNLFTNDKRRGYIAFCLLDPNLEPLSEETVSDKDLTSERLLAKFDIAMHGLDVGWHRSYNCLVFVMAYAKEDGTEDEDVIKLNSSRMQNFLAIVEEDFGISMSAAVGEPFATADKCEESIRFALKMVDFMCFAEARVSVVDIVCCQETKNFLSRKYPDYRLVNYERPIIAAVLNHNYLHAELVLKKLLIAHLCDPLDVFHTTRTAVLYLCRLVVSLVVTDPLKASKTYPELSEMIEKMRVCSTLSEMQNLIHRFFIFIQNCANGTKYDATNTKILRIIEFVNANYKNPLFDAGMISEKFDITPSYLSRIFKEHTGVNLSTYIQTLRINAAKELLTTTDLTVEKIAKKIGFLGGQNLQRLFNKYEGISPLEFKRISLGIREVSEATEIKTK